MNDANMPDLLLVQQMLQSPEISIYRGTLKATKPVSPEVNYFFKMRYLTTSEEMKHPDFYDDLKADPQAPLFAIAGVVSSVMNISAVEWDADTIVFPIFK